MHLPAAIPGELTPGTYRGIAQDLLTFVANVSTRRGALDCYCTSEGGHTGVSTG